MKKVIFLMLFALVTSIASAQCDLPAATYNSTNNRLTIKEKDRGSLYQFQWGPTGTEYTITKQVSMFHGGGGQLVLSLNENNNTGLNSLGEPLYVFGGMQDGWTASVSKYCSGSFVNLITVADSDY